MHVEGDVGIDPARELRVPGCALRLVFGDRRGRFASRLGDERGDRRRKVRRGCEGGTPHDAGETDDDQLEEASHPLGRSVLSDQRHRSLSINT